MALRLSMTCAMDDVTYRHTSTVFEDRDDTLSNVVEGHLVYHMEPGADGLQCVHDKYEDPICSPRSLRDMCSHAVIDEPSVVKHLTGSDVPCNLYACLIREAILQRQLQSIDYLVSSWPLPYLKVHDVIPRGEDISPDYLTRAVKGHDVSTLIDCFIVGLLNLGPQSRIRHIDFTGFSKDRRLCRELTRLPILWMDPRHRRKSVIHSMLANNLDISKDKVQRYINRISCIYAGIDTCFCHEQAFGPVTITLDCQATIDEVPIGLALQRFTPFRFAYRKLWLCPIADVIISTHLLISLFNPLMISHLEVEDHDLCADMDRFDDLIDALLCLPNLVALGLPNSIHTDVYANACVDLSEVLPELTYLERLDLSSCNLRNSLPTLLATLNQNLQYLNLRDCRLGSADLRYFLTWTGLGNIRELNLSRNNMQQSVALLTNSLRNMPLLTRFSLSYCSLLTTPLADIVYHCAQCPHLVFLAIQGFTPPSISEISYLLRNVKQLPSLRTCLILPDAYAFPGNNDRMRRQCKTHMLGTCLQEMIRLGSSHISID